MSRGSPVHERSAVRRRAVTIPRVVVLFVALTATAPLLFAGALVVDVVRWASSRRPAMATRLVALAWVYLAAEVLGLIAMLAVWLAGPPWSARGRLRIERGTFTVQRAWTVSIFGAFKRLFSLRVDVDGADVVAPGPVLVLVRHVSLVDTLVPSVFALNPNRMRGRFVLKQELLGDPCLDVAGNRLPNYFVDRASANSHREIERVRALGEELAGFDEAAVIYPEGTRFREDRLQRALEDLRERDPVTYARAARLRRVLPPRLGGTLALLDAARDADVVVCAHHGFDGFTYIRRFWSGELIGRTISVRLRRFPRRAIPADTQARIGWLYERWYEIDEWVAGREAEAAAA